MLVKRVMKNLEIFGRRLRNLITARAKRLLPPPAYYHSCYYYTCYYLSAYNRGEYHNTAYYIIGYVIISFVIIRLVMIFCVIGAGVRIESVLVSGVTITFIIISHYIITFVIISPDIISYVIYSGEVRLTIFNDLGVVFKVLKAYICFQREGKPKQTSYLIMNSEGVRTMFDYNAKEACIIANVAAFLKLPYEQVAGYAWNIVRLDDKLTFRGLKEEAEGAIRVY